MLRAVRFEQRFGFQIEERTLQLMHEARDLLRQVSGDRLRHELDLILAEEDPLPALKRLEDLQLLTAIHPDLHWEPHLAEPMHKVLKEPLEPAWDLPESWGGTPIRRALAYLVWFLPLPAEKSAGIAQRLRLPHHLREGLRIGANLIPDLKNLPDLTPSQVVARLDGVPLPVIYAFYQLHYGTEIATVLCTYATQWRHILPVTDGHTLRKMGLPPGPTYRRILWTLRAAWLDGQVHSADQERALLEQLLASRTP
jgi:tRNA nucleotidyltransferase (CCA-adding enzyme)